MSSHDVRTVGTAETILVKRGLASNLKDEATKLARLYGSNIQIQLDVKHDSDLVLLRVTEYNL